MMEDFISGVFIAFIIAVFMCLFDIDYSMPEEHHMAEEVCSSNSGYKKIGFSLPLLNPPYKIVCNDGAIFYRSVEDLNKFKDDSNEQQENN